MVSMAAVVAAVRDSLTVPFRDCLPIKESFADMVKRSLRSRGRMDKEDNIVHRS
jgi:hypothetical protein